jgi:hypothetical protein
MITDEPTANGGHVADGTMATLGGRDTTSTASSPPETSWALRTTASTRRHPDDAYFISPEVSSEEHAGMVDLGADGDPRNR